MAKKSNLKGNMKLNSTSDLTLDDILDFVRENMPCGNHDPESVRKAVDSFITHGTIGSVIGSGAVGGEDGGSYGVPGVGIGVTISGSYSDKVKAAIASNASARSGKCPVGLDKVPGIVKGVMAAAGKYNPDIAKSSIFFRAVMANGEVWSPYTNRRFLPAQFLHMMERYNGNIEKALGASYNYPRWRRVLRDEVEKLAFMEKNWKTAFAERSLFFPVETVREIILEQINALEHNLMDRSLCRFSKRHGDYYRKVEGQGSVALWHHTKSIISGDNGGSVVHETVEPTSWLKRTLSSIADCRRVTNSARGYDELVNAIDHMPWIPMGTYYSQDGSIRNWLPRAWKEAFKRAGAFYTLKSLVTGGHVLYSSDDIECASIADSLDALKRLAAADEPAFVVYAILKKSIKDSKFNVSRFLSSVCK